MKNLKQFCAAPLFLIASYAAAQPFPDAHDPVPAGWTNPAFKLSQDYPTSLPPAEPQPWKSFDFKTQPEQYIRAVLAYAYEGNIDADWYVENNAVRRWYHAPWMHWGDSGREFIHGMTRERPSGKFELHPSQNVEYQNWAVGLYNAPGGFTVGQVWKNHTAPDPTLARFPDGTVSIKLLFTTATPTKVPYLKNSKEWRGYIHRSMNSSSRKERPLRLLQIDIAVRDSRADATTGWVFGTFVYDGDGPTGSPWNRMVPVGLMWGNDPGVTEAMVNSGTQLQETWINPGVGPPQHLGWARRLNGPVDNPRSSCLSCHSTASSPRGTILPPPNGSTPTILNWFRNIKAGDRFDPAKESLDYSLQLSAGIVNLKAWQTSNATMLSPITDAPPLQGAVNRGVEDEPEDEDISP